jgi:hypothetical protein
MKFLTSKTGKITFGLLGLFLLTTGISYFSFSYFGTKGGPSAPLSPAGVAQKRSQIDTSGPKTEECPLNGKMYTKAEKDIWTSRRPLTVMIENHEESRPQSGLSTADVVYEAVAEGGITRFMGVFYCGVSAEETQVGPVRSARMYYLDWASEYASDDHPLYAHVGGANTPGPADALGAIKKYGWDQYNDMNQFSIGFPTFWRDYERLGHTVATEHTMYSTTDKLWKIASDRGLNATDKKGVAWDKSFVKWSFADGKPAASPKVSRISFPFMGGYDDYIVAWAYDAASNSYKRDNGGQAHKDFNTDQQIMVNNVLVQYTGLKGPIDTLKHMLYDTVGTGKVLLFQNGEVVEGTWSKASRTARTIYKDKQGKELQFVRGNIWVEVLDPKTTVTQN